MFLGLPAPLFTMDLVGIPQRVFQRFFDMLSPMFDHMISLGQSNTIISCPYWTTHSELDEAALAASGLSPTTVRVAIGDEDPRDLIEHFIATAEVAIDPEVPGFSAEFPAAEQINELIRSTYVSCHRDYIES